jgi:hypothetical protein
MRHRMDDLCGAYWYAPQKYTILWSILLYAPRKFLFGFFKILDIFQILEFLESFQIF